MFEIMLENNVWYYAWADASEDSPCQEKKVDNFVFKLEIVVETKVEYFYNPSPKNSKVSDHDINPSQTMTLTQAKPWPPAQWVVSAL